MKFSLTFTFCLFVNILLSQLNWGFRIGNSFSTFENNIITTINFGSPSKVRQVSGIDVLGFIKYEWNPNFSIQTEIHFLTKGGEILHEVNPPNRENNESTFFRFEFLEFPVLINYNFLQKDFLYLFIGGSFGYGISRRDYGNNYCREEINFSACYRALGSKGGVHGAAKKDISGLVGFSINEKFRNKKLVFDIRYLHDFNNGIKYIIIEKPLLRHRNWLFTIGIEF